MAKFTIDLPDEAVDKIFDALSKKSVTLGSAVDRKEMLSFIKFYVIRNLTKLVQKEE